MPPKNFTVRRNQTFLLILFGATILFVAYFHSLSLNGIKKLHLYTDQNHLYLVYQRKPFLPKELNTYLVKVDLEKKSLSRAIFKQTSYMAGFVENGGLWLFHKNSLSAYQYVPPPKNSLVPSKFDYVQYCSPEKLGADPNFVVYDQGTLQNQRYLFGSSEPKNVSAFKFEALKMLPLDLKISFDSELKKFVVLSRAQDITLLWQKVNDLKTVFFCHFDGKTFSPEQKISFESDLKHFAPYGESDFFILYTLQQEPKTIYFKKQNADVSWPAQPQVLRFKEAHLISNLSAFSLCTIRGQIYLAVGTAGIPILFQAKTLEETWEFFKSDLTTTPKSTPSGMED